ncbi:MAG: prolipoprotein diacylglyceryl transferase [Ktedonobacteraceae bacterium]|nr:prolipoprotein diacylglyceryl transferase [Ktedonobacteraceae bacterium]
MYPPINPILVHLGPLSIRWYAITMLLAIALGTYVAGRYVARQGRDPNTVWDMLLWILVPALIGARLYYVFIQSPRGPQGLGNYLAHPIEILQIWNGGIHIYGALIFGGIALLIYVRLRKLPFLVYLDGIGLGLLLGQAIGRLGNFINQELYGPPTTLPWGLRIDAAHRIAPYNDLARYPESMRFQPLFLYELVWDALGFALLLWISRRFQSRLRDGDLILMYLIWAPAGRFFIEFFRSDSWFFPGTPFNILHVLIAIIVLSAATILVSRFIRRKPDVPALQPAGESSVAVPAREEGALETPSEDQVSAQAEAKTLEDPGVGSLRTEG